ncbi:MAG TPA: hypothetical protein DCM14_02970 [Clostridiales bacterium UBA8153]|nr:hypothetical protein [Clostridiales bacterium UBA8153]
MTDYQEAVQHPARCFRDAELRRGAAMRDRLGLPVPMTGNFASVYRVVTGGASYAARCFLRYRPDHGLRYAAISRCLGRHGFAFTVPFEYQPDGMRVRDHWYPLVKMEWAEGQTLGSFIESHLDDRAALAMVQARLHQVVTQLAGASVAHGDLQPANVLVTVDGVRLIDYDGMYVPDLGGTTAPELGHPHFQHPRRLATHFGPYLDGFSLLVMGISLTALQLEPGLWQELKAGDDCLLLRREDFLHPGHTRAWQVLKKLRDPALANGLDRLLHCLARPADAPVPMERPGPSREVPRPAGSEQTSSRRSAAPESRPEAVGGPVFLAGEFWAERLITLVVVGWCGAVSYWVWARGLPAWVGWQFGGGGLAALVLGLAGRYATLPLVRTKHRLQLGSLSAGWRRAYLGRRLARFQARYHQLRQQRDQRLTLLDQEEARLRSAEAVEVTKVHRELQEKLAAFDREREGLKQLLPQRYFTMLVANTYRAMVLREIQDREARAVQFAAGKQERVRGEFAPRLSRVASRRAQLHAWYGRLGLEARQQELQLAVAWTEQRLSHAKRSLQQYHRVTLPAYWAGILGRKRADPAGRP